jgi:hypothetical protein
MAESLSPLSRYLARRDLNQQAGVQDLQAAGQVHGLLAKMQAEQRQRQFEAEIGAAQTPEQQIAVATKYGAPKDVLHWISTSKDRQATIDATRATQAQTDLRHREIAADREATRRDIAGNADTLRRDLEQRDEALKRELAAGKQDAPIVQTDDEGNTTLWDRSGKKIADLGKTGKVNATVFKERQAKAKLQSDLNAIIPNLENISRDGGLIDQSTGSGAGALVDIGAGFFGKATPGSIAVGRLKPLIDPVLKLVPRFEGPQSDKDTKLYQDAAGDLANPATPNPRKKAAAKEILEIYKRRRDQFSTTDYDAAVPPVAAPVAPRIVDW